MVIVNLGRKKKPHTQGKNHQTPAQRCTHLFVWVSLPAGTALTQLSSKSRHRTARKGPDGSTEERGRNGRAAEGGRIRRPEQGGKQHDGLEGSIYRLWRMSDCLLLKRQSCHKLELAEEKLRRQNAHGRSQDRFPV